jgi:hypothetical protein
MREQVSGSGLKVADKFARLLRSDESRILESMDSMALLAKASGMQFEVNSTEAVHGSWIRSGNEPWVTESAADLFASASIAAKSEGQKWIGESQMIEALVSSEDRELRAVLHGVM